MKLQERITYFNPNRHFGFIRTADDKEFFFHGSNFANDFPALNLNVYFDIAPPIKEGKQPQAVNITAVGIAEPLSEASR